MRVFPDKDLIITDVWELSNRSFMMTCTEDITIYLPQPTPQLSFEVVQLSEKTLTLKCNTPTSGFIWGERKNTLLFHGGQGIRGSRVIVESYGDSWLIKPFLTIPQCLSLQER